MDHMRLAGEEEVLTVARYGLNHKKKKKKKTNGTDGEIVIGTCRRVKGAKHLAQPYACVDLQSSPVTVVSNRKTPWRIIPELHQRPLENQVL